jgi:hypothetical protein
MRGSISRISLLAPYQRDESNLSHPIRPCLFVDVHAEARLVSAGININAVRVILAGIVAGTLATLAQLLLWVAAGDNAWTLLLRDARLTAALVLGKSALWPPAGFDAGILLAATGIHLALSVIYAALLLPVATRLAPVPSLLAGAGFGALLYFVNLYGFAVIFPWFAEARGGITLAVHPVFGMAVMLTYKRLGVHCATDRRRTCC